MPTRDAAVRVFARYSQVSYTIARLIKSIVAPNAL